MKRMSMILVSLVFAVAACGKKPAETKQEPAPTPTTASGSAVTDPGSGSGAVATGSGDGSAPAAAALTPPRSSPTAVDFEADATAKITDKNLEAEVKALEAQLAQ